MKNGYLFVSIFALGLAYAANSHWNLLSASREIAKVTLVSENVPAQIPQKKPLSLERRVLNSTLHVMQQSHLIFSESWRLVVGTSSIPKSVMKELSIRLAAAQLSAEPCAQESLQLDVQDAVQGNIFATLKHNDCSRKSSQTVAEIQWQKFEKTKLSDLEVKFHPNQMPEGVGDSLAILNAEINCHYQIGEDERIVKMSCTNLGQGVGRVEHYHFSKFEYLSEQNDLLVVEADHYRNLMEKIGCVSDKPCLSLRVPLQGIIHLVDDRRKGKAAATAAVAAMAAPKAPPVAAEPVQPVAAAAPAEDVKSNEALNSPQNPDIKNPNLAPDPGHEMPMQVQQQMQQQMPQQLGDSNGKVEGEVQNQSAQQGLPSENPVGGPSAELQPAIDGGESALIQSREPSGQDGGPVLLPEGQHPGVYR